MESTLTLTPALVRRLAIARQRLAGPPPAAGPAGILDLVRDLRCLQLDPTSIVARSHLLVLWSRLGVYDPAALDILLWQDRQLFEYWAHAASIVLSEDYPIHAHWMRQFATGEARWSRRVQEWMDANAELRQYILAELTARGPLRTQDFEDRGPVPWSSSGWTAGRNVDRMLNFLWTAGAIMIAGRQSGHRLWDLAARCLPPALPRPELSEQEVVRLAAQHALRALGVATPTQIRQHFTRGGYPELDRVLADLVAEGAIRPVAIAAPAREWAAPWYIHTADLPLLDQLAAGAWTPRTTLLSPFDNLICDRARTELLFDFRFRIEIYVPKAQRQYGYFVLPILHGDRLIGRVDPALDRRRQRLTIQAVHAEPDAPATPEMGAAVAGAVAELGAFLGAQEIVYGDHVPPGWRPALLDSPRRPV
ncbi:MAG TPA: crosslink repair DNA glycosylase YcaQ family protein [Chloroflexia bacterium]|nr:crosslink repair DNA glycosylase YcaQ family protein [Chloroflexia bacterium]